MARLRTIVVEQHGDHHHRAHEELEPVGVDAGVEDAHLHEAEDEGAEHGADRRAVAAGQQRAADHHRDDRLELLLGAAQRVGRAGRQHLDRGEERRRQRRQHEQRDLGARHRHADVARRVGIAAAGEDPVAEPGAQQDPGEDQRSAPIHHRIDTGMPCTIGSPSGALGRSRRCSASHAISGRPNWPAKSGASQSPAVSLVHAGDLGAPGDAAGQTPSVSPRSMNRLPSVTMKDGSPVLHHDKPVEAADQPPRSAKASTSDSHRSASPRASPEWR